MPNSAPTTTTSRVKLRSSCDRCSSNKIKCSQEKPVCQRCRSLDQQCNYSRSMRSGKPPRSRQRMSTIMGNRKVTRENCQSSSSTSNGFSLATTIGDIKNVSQASPAVSMPVPVSCLEGINLETMLATNASHPANPYGLFYTENNLFGTSERFFSNASMEYAPSHSLLKQGDTGLPTPFSLLAPPTAPRQATENNSPEEHKPQAPYLSPCPSFSMKTSESRGFSPLAASFEKPPLSRSASVSDALHDCVSLALRTLASLYHLSTARNKSVPATRTTKVEETGYSLESCCSAPMIDQVLQVNSSAIKNTITILSCPYCVKDFCFPILMGVIYSKILTWYQATVNINDPDLEVVITQDNHDINNHYPPSKRESVLHRPFSVGTYKLDDEVGKLMKHQLVLNELREMDKSVQMFLHELYSQVRGGSINSSNNNNCNATSEDCGRAGEHIYLRMGISLNTRLRYTIQELEKILPPNHS